MLTRSPELNTNGAIKALKVLADIADAYDQNELHDEARKYTDAGVRKNYISPSNIPLYHARHGKVLLTLQDCLDARHILEHIDQYGLEL